MLLLCLVLQLYIFVVETVDVAVVFCVDLVSRDVAVLSCVAVIVAVTRDVAVECYYVAVVSRVAALWALEETPDVA